MLKGSIHLRRKGKKFLSLVLMLSMLLGSMGSVVVPKADATNEPEQTTILDGGATWSYLADGTNLDGEDWQTASSAYDTSGWLTGTAPIGYASVGSEVYGMLSTKLTRPSEGSYPTTYYKTTAEIPDGTDLEHVTISGSYLIDDGLFLYVNGTLVYTCNVNENAAGYENWSSEAIETPVWTDFTLPADKVSAFTTGTNVITAVLKNQGSESSDSLIALELDLSVEEEEGQEGQRELVDIEGEPSAPGDISNLTLQPGSDESEMNFCWYSDPATTECSVQIAEKAEMTGEEFPAEAASFASFTGTVSAASDGQTSSTHNSNEVTVTGLSPGTEYVYHVGDGTSFSAIYSFETKDPSGGYEAILVGDPQIGSSGNESGDMEGWANTVEQALDSFSDASFILSAGDQVEDWDSETQYDGFFSPPELREVPLVPTIGNHDNGVLYKYHYNSPNESATYGTTSAGGDYWFTYGNTLYMVLNSNNRTSLSHDAFIGQAIDANPDVKWKIVMFHHSIYSSANHSTDDDILDRRSGLYPVFDKYDIDVVLMGHDHSYTRSYQMLGGVAQTDQDYDTEGRVVNPTGTLYITANSGSGSKYYDFQSADTAYMATRWQGHSLSYSSIQVTGDTFSITTYDVADMNEPIDTYTIYKGDNPGEIATNYAYLTAALDAEIGTDHGSPNYVLSKSDYTADSWNAYTAAIAAGITVEANPDATQAQVDAAKLAITVAKAALVLRNSGDITPYFITLQPGADETRMNFSWATDSGDGTCSVQIAKTADMVDEFIFPETAQTVSGVVFPAASDLYSNKAVVTGLEPSTEYSYRVGYGTHYSKVNTFTTGDGESYSALLVGDPQIGASGNATNDTAGWSNTVAKMRENFGEASFILSAGDQVDTADSEQQYLGFFAPPELAHTPLAPTIGNHDNNIMYQLVYNSPNVSSEYGLTAAGGDYWFRYGNTLYMVINSNNMTSLSHDAFIGTAIAANPDVKWKIVMFHHSIYSSASHSTDDDILGRREGLYPVFDKYDIDVVLMGHDHSYTRSYQMLGGEAKMNQTVDGLGRVVNPTGTLYITANSGSGSKYYDFKNADTAYMATRWQGHTPSYSNIVVTDDTFTITTYVTGTDAQIDTYTIYKGEASGIASATLAADGATLTTDPSDTIALSLSAKDGLGGDVNLSGADIVYKTSPEGILSVDSDGVATLQSAPAADTEVKIWAEVTLDGVTVSSNQISVYLAVGVIDLRVRQAQDDMEEWLADGNMDYDSSDLEIGWESPTSGDKEEQLVGVRFSDLKIPRGATITGAYIQFTVDEPNKSADPFNIKIYAEDTANAGAFANVRYNISSRTKTGDYVTWNNCPLWTVEHESNANERTPDISSLLQQIVDQDEWSAGNAVSLIMTGTGNRTAEAYDGEPTMAPVLHLSYTMDDGITRVRAARDELIAEMEGGRYTYASVEAAQDVVDVVNAALADGISDEEESQLLTAISDAKDHLVLINQASLMVSENTILGSDRSITFRVTVDQLQGVDVMEGTLQVTDDRFEITKIESLYQGNNFVFMKNLDYGGDGATAYFSLAQVGGFNDTAQMNVVDVTVTLKDGEIATSLETVLDMVRMYIGNLEDHTASEVYSNVTGNGTAETRIWIPGDVAADLDGNGRVNGADLSIALTYFGAQGSDTDWYTSGAWRVDLDQGEGGEDLIDIGDLTIIAWMAAGSPEIN